MIQRKIVLALLRSGKESYDLRGYVQEAVWKSKRNLQVLTDLETVIEGPMEELPLDSIKRCDLFICAVTEKSPNIMFGAGYAKGLHKDTILICERSRVPQKGMKDWKILEYELDELKYRSEKFVYHLADEIEKRFCQYRDLFFGYCTSLNNARLWREKWPSRFHTVL